MTSPADTKRLYAPCAVPSIALIGLARSVRLANRGGVPQIWTMTHTATLTDFTGVWTLDRAIQHADGLRARFLGQAIWRPDPKGLAYQETGEMVLGDGTRFLAERRYLWSHDLSVWFEDGRFFHRVPPNGGEAAHWCDPDQYDGHYDFADWPEFTVTWCVRGPRKDYGMETRYRRACDFADAAAQALG
jgi:hypothetical protein